MKKNSSNEKSAKVDTLSIMTNKDLRDKYLQIRKAIEEHPFELDFEKTEEMPEELEELLRMEKIYSKELQKRELLEWALRTGC